MTIKYISLNFGEMSKVFKKVKLQQIFRADVRSIIFYIYHFEKIKDKLLSVDGKTKPGPTWYSSFIHNLPAL